mgnify:CR=1 FL=1
MHALHQVRRSRDSVGRGRFSLWTGDVGVALYLLGCLHEDDRMPGLDSLTHAGRS